MAMTAGSRFEAAGRARDHQGDADRSTAVMPSDHQVERRVSSLMNSLRTTRANDSR
jgi:hypothetical protein